MSAAQPELRALHGNGALIEALEEALADARSGKLEAVALVLCNDDRCCYTNFLAREGAPYAWARLASGVAWLNHRPMTAGL